MHIQVTSHAGFTNATVIEGLVRHALPRLKGGAYKGAKGAYTVIFAPVSNTKAFAAVWLKNCTVAGHVEVTL